MLLIVGILHPIKTLGAHPLSMHLDAMQLDGLDPDTIFASRDTTIDHLGTNGDMIRLFSLLKILVAVTAGHRPKGTCRRMLMKLHLTSYKVATRLAMKAWIGARIVRHHAVIGLIGNFSIKLPWVRRCRTEWAFDLLDSFLFRYSKLEMTLDAQ